VFRESGARRKDGRGRIRRPDGVPAGSFEDVIVVRSEQWDPEWDATQPLHSYEDYYARGVGLIRSVSRNNSQWFWMSVEQGSSRFIR
jgi:hypothetical protein